MIAMGSRNTQENQHIIGMSNIKNVLDVLEADGGDCLKRGDTDMLFRLIPDRSKVLDRSDANVSVRRI